MVTAILAGIAIWQGFQLKRTLEETRKSGELARQEFIAKFVPRLIVRRISIHTDIKSPIGGEGRDLLSVDYQIANIGGTSLE